MSYREDLIKGYAEVQEDKKEIELSAEDKQLLETKDLDSLSARALMRLAYLRGKENGKEE